jgi:hypothetical protein
VKLGIETKGLPSLRKAIGELSARYGVETTPSVIVGYTASYALFVHENIEMKWRGLPRKPNPPHKGNYWDPAGRGQSKFLEQPAREIVNSHRATDILVTALKKKVSLLHALYLVGLAIQRDSQLIVPVDFGNLKASAFTRKE